MVYNEEVIAGFRRFLALAVLLPFSLPSHATTLLPTNIDDQVKQAEMIFQGEVTEIRYSKSSIRKGHENQLPLTFVTFKVEKILKGNMKEPEKITLRFLGGRGAGSKFLMISGCPLFDKGDKDILFVRRNGKQVCPLTGWQQGRFRIIHGSEVYNEEGQEVCLTSDQRLTFGKGFPLEEVLTHQVSKTIIRKSWDEAKGEGQALGMSCPQGSRLNFTSFTEFILQRVGKLFTPAQLSALPPVESVHPEAEFPIPFLKAVPPPGEDPEISKKGLPIWWNQRGER